ncbi:hypothetical protein Tco_0369700 [Tanacetum coccineum]
MVEYPCIAMQRLYENGSSPLTQAGMADSVPVPAVIVAAQRERVKYEAKCADISPPTEADLKVLRVKTWMVDFVPSRAVIDATHRKWVKYEAKRANIGYGFLPLFIFFTWGIREGCGEPTEADPKVLRSSPLTQTEMIYFVLGRAVLEAAQRKRVKYKAKCADIGYGFLSFSFSSFGELENDAVTLLKRIQKFFVA